MSKVVENPDFKIINEHSNFHSQNTDPNPKLSTNPKKVRKKNTVTVQKKITQKRKNENSKRDREKN